MTTLLWDQVEARRYETGIDRGVFYPSEGPGVVWNGLLSVEESLSGGEQISYANDGLTYLNTVNGTEYEATVTAFSAPREFSPCVGDLEVVPGFILTKQPRQSFSLAYRTLVGSTGYKIHLVYNVQAKPSYRSYASTNDTPDPLHLEWTLSATPFLSGPYRPTAHFIVDSTKTAWYALLALENILYGVPGVDPRLPWINEVSNILNTSESPDIILEPITETI